MNIKHSKEQIDQIRRDYEGGIDPKILCNLLGIRIGSLYSLLHKHGIKRSPAGSDESSAKELFDHRGILSAAGFKDLGEYMVRFVYNGRTSECVILASDAKELTACFVKVYGKKGVGIVSVKSNRSILHHGFKKEQEDYWH